jgi:hypothetical protein
MLGWTSYLMDSYINDIHASGYAANGDINICCSDEWGRASLKVIHDKSVFIADIDLNKQVKFTFTKEKVTCEKCNKKLGIKNGHKNTL